ncbi:hypothetical protein DACRYDRAFT_104043 [Dacryopinax primogenitus]|uniref:Uncharacterized protein n=1 Tax=Dacryopinax primogenitus (strain DJM 731) TaxID=1858805 RepID=M5GEN2_DACPD|nr:uncharacterized protein DACRYDRAFT_104043 [Dacryopinax primogenitus]EJU05557.1 hypothetical protein DACRYDRAFT_104043 [Dacryopinax primogenitus]
MPSAKLRQMYAHLNTTWCMKIEWELFQHPMTFKEAEQVWLVAQCKRHKAVKAQLAEASKPDATAVVSDVPMASLFMDRQVAQMHVGVLRANAGFRPSTAFPVAQASTSQPNIMPAAAFHDYLGYTPGAESLPIPSKLGANMTTKSMAASLPSEKLLTALDLHANPAFVKKYAEPYWTVMKEHKRSTSLLRELEEVLLPILGSLAKQLAAAQCPTDVVGFPSTLLGKEAAEDWQKAKEKMEREMEKLEKQREKEQAMWDAALATGEGGVYMQTSTGTPFYV